MFACMSTPFRQNHALTPPCAWSDNANVDVNKQTVSEHDAEMRMLTNSLGKCERLANHWPCALNAAARQQWPTMRCKRQWPDQ
eukprot:3260571-Alexandrium_andersonii.AAC.1